jgi:hypothetical protein
MSEFRKVAYVERSLPWPFANRELYICASAMLIKERDRKGALTILRSVNEDREKLWGLEIPKENTHHIVRANMIRGFMFMEKIDEDSCWYNGFINMNPNVAFIPDSFFGFMVKRIIYVIIGKIRTKDMYHNHYV